MAYTWSYIDSESNSRIFTVCPGVLWKIRLDGGVMKISNLWAGMERLYIIRLVSYRQNLD